MRLERSEVKIIFLLACIQFTHTVDFVLMMPLAPIFMKAFDIGPDKFSLLVSSYTWSSSIFGLLGALFVDRFDRKRTLLTCYGGFAFGTALCAISSSVWMLLGARTLAGAFAGLMISTVFSIVADIVPEVRRGTALGMVMAAFPLASLLGVPFGVYLANLFDWHAPFSVLAGASFIILIVMAFLIPPVRGHLSRQHHETSVQRLMHFVKNGRYYPGISFAFLLMLAAFTVIPFIAAYLTSNVGVPSDKIYLVYLCGGAFTFFSSQLIGRMVDQYGKLKMFRWIAGLSIVPIFLVTHLPEVSVFWAVAVTTLFMIFVSGRFVPAMSLITGNVEPERRGAYMSFSTSVQHMGSGLSAFLAGMILTTSPDGKLQSYGTVGYIAIFFTLVCLFLAGRMKTYADKVG